MSGKRKYWYKHFIEECVLCGRTSEWRERQYTKKPKKAIKRHIYMQTACRSHFG